MGLWEDMFTVNDSNDVGEQFTGADLGQMAAGIPDIAQNFLTYSAQTLKADAYMGKASDYETAALMSRMAAERNNLSLTQKFNSTNASSAVIAAAQGRTFEGSVSDIFEASDDQYNWDREFITLGGEYGYHRNMASKYGMEAAAHRTRGMAIAGLGIGLLNSAQKITDAFGAPSTSGGE